MKQDVAVTAFGELLLRLDTPGHERFLQAGSLNVSFTGGEANVAVNLRQWGHKTRIISRVPAHEIGTACCNHFQRYGVDVSHVARGGERLGLFFVETGASQRGSKVIYDRDDTSFRSLQPGDINWDTALSGSGLFHFTGTAPAAGEMVRQVLRDGLAVAAKRDIPVSFDCSYRPALWSQQEAADALPEFLQAADVFIGSDLDAKTFFGAEQTGDDAMRELQQRYELKTVAFTNRRIDSTGINYYEAAILNGSEIAKSPEHAIAVVDRIGTGDAFVAGVIHGLLLKRPLAELTNFAVAAAVLKHTVPGDFALSSTDEVESLASGGNTGRVQR